ncbi:hypothetical protein FB45DRAFT_1029757 [Roridomyces roridus]|uniref:Uncharacterized protein n=1 Tax=Roridomyces roridus TaxID=1738132 RepID=A0AAD7FMN3_9AGAR|nr:hypothetical protein FB45DRAFT_1029757 [Roridomyces roridus]
MLSDIEPIDGVVVPCHITTPTAPSNNVSALTNDIAASMTPLTNDTAASMTPSLEHAPASPIHPDTSTLDTLLDGALLDPSSPPLQEPPYDLLLNTNTDLETMETSTLGAHQLFDDDDDDMHIDYEASTSAPERYVVRLPKLPSEYIVHLRLEAVPTLRSCHSQSPPPPSKCARTTSEAEQKDPSSERVQWRKRRRVLRRVTAWVQGISEEEDHPGLGATATDYDTDADSDELEITHSEFEARLIDLHGPDSGEEEEDEDHLSLSDEEEDHNPLDLVADNSDREGPVSEDEDEDALDIEMPADRAFVAMPSSKKGRAVPPAAVLSFLDLHAKDSDGEEDDEGENSVAGDFIVEDEPFDVHDENLYKMDDDGEEPFDILVDELQDSEQRKCRERRYAQELQREHQREQRRQGVSFSSAQTGRAYPEEDVNPFLAKAFREVMREVVRNDPVYADDPKEPLVRQGDWVLLKRRPRVVGYVLDDQGRRFLIKNTKPSSTAALRIQKVIRPRTRKAAPVVHPTPHDLQPFLRSERLQLEKPHWGRTSYALSPGDLAFVVTGPARRFRGLIDHLKKNEDGEYLAILVGWPSEHPHPLMSQLRRHLLDPGPIPRICDRVLVVDGPYRDEVAVIESIHGHRVSISSEIAGSVEVDIRDVIRHFLPGDSVRIPGEEKGGILMELQPSLGAVSVLLDPKKGMVKEVPVSQIHFDWSKYPAPWTRPTYSGTVAHDRTLDALADEADEVEESKVRVLIDKAYKSMRKEKALAPGAIIPRKLRAMVKAERAHSQGRWWDAVDALKEVMDLQLEDDVPITRRLAAAISARANGAVHKARQSSDELKDLNRRLMKTGLRFENLEVKIIIGNYPTRTLKGTIVADHDSEERRAREKYDSSKELLRLCRHDLDGILATIAYEHHQPVENVPIENIVEWETGVPLSRAVYLKQGWHARTLQLPDPLPPAPNPTERTSTPPPEPEPSSLPFELPGETDGSWLHQGTRFVGKCLEVLVHITDNTKGNKAAPIGKVHREKHGKAGFLCVTEEYTKKSRISVFGLPPNGNLVKFASTCLVPLRKHADGARVDERVQERVVVIGKNHLHDTSNIGEHGLVVSRVPPDHVLVQHMDSSQDRYHWKSLCISTNKDRFQGDTAFPATNFV